jgi:tetratricopeptide (TPR) repeat protein
MKSVVNTPEYQPQNDEINFKSVEALANGKNSHPSDMDLAIFEGLLDFMGSNKRSENLEELKKILKTLEERSFRYKNLIDSIDKKKMPKLYRFMTSPIIASVLLGIKPVSILDFEIIDIEIDEKIDPDMKNAFKDCKKNFFNIPGYVSTLQDEYKLSTIYVLLKKFGFNKDIDVVPSGSMYRSGVKTSFMINDNNAVREKMRKFLGEKEFDIFFKKYKKKYHNDKLIFRESENLLVCSFMPSFFQNIVNYHLFYALFFGFDMTNAEWYEQPSSEMFARILIKDEREEKLDLSDLLRKESYDIAWFVVKKKDRPEESLLKLEQANKKIQGYIYLFQLFNSLTKHEIFYMQPYLYVNQKLVHLSVQLKDQGNDFFYKNKYSEALSLYTNALVLNKNNTKFDSEFASKLYYNRGMCYLKLCDYAKAIQNFTKAIQLNPNYKKAHQNRDQAFKKLLELEISKEGHEKLEILSVFATLNFFQKNLKGTNQNKAITWSIHLEDLLQIMLSVKGTNILFDNRISPVDVLRLLIENFYYNELKFQLPSMIIEDIIKIRAIRASV